jgi:hypothetical protein
MHSTNGVVLTELVLAAQALVPIPPASMTAATTPVRIDEARILFSP